MKQPFDPARCEGVVYGTRTRLLLSCLLAFAVREAKTT